MATDVTLETAWEMLRTDPASVLVDVRTTAEWNFVGIPDLSRVGKEPRLVQWITFPAGSPNEDFIDQAAQGLSSDQPILLLCRSGARSRAAADALVERGFEGAVNVVAGFEGDLDSDGHRHGGWKDVLPWRQS